MALLSRHRAAPLPGPVIKQADSDASSAHPPLAMPSAVGRELVARKRHCRAREREGQWVGWHGGDILSGWASPPPASQSGASRGVWDSAPERLEFSNPHSHTKVTQ